LKVKSYIEIYRIFIFGLVIFIWFNQLIESANYLNLYINLHTTSIRRMYESWIYKLFVFFIFWFPSKIYQLIFIGKILNNRCNTHMPFENWFKIFYILKFYQNKLRWFDFKTTSNFKLTLLHGTHSIVSIVFLYFPLNFLLFFSDLNPTLVLIHCVFNFQGENFFCVVYI